MPRHALQQFARLESRLQPPIRRKAERRKEIGKEEVDEPTSLETATLVRNRGQLPATNYSRMSGFTSQSFGRYGRFRRVEALLLSHQPPRGGSAQASRRGDGNIYPRACRRLFTSGHN